MPRKKARLNVAMVGYGFMGAAHSQAWRVAPRFFDLPLEPHLHTIVGRDAERVEAAADRFGWANSETDWRRAIENDDIDLIDICSPGDTHSEIAIAALEAGKHVLCEKPLANDVADAERMTAVAEAANGRGVRSMVGFSYRRVPAITFARQLVADGRLGSIRQVRAQYLQDWLVDADGPMTWRLDKSLAGSGSLGDIGAHAIDMVQFITGLLLTEVSGTLHTFVTERPLLGEGVGLGGIASSERGQVTVDDVALFTARLGVVTANWAHCTSFKVRLSIDSSIDTSMCEPTGVCRMAFSTTLASICVSSSRSPKIRMPGMIFPTRVLPASSAAGANASTTVANASLRSNSRKPERRVPASIWAMRSRAPKVASISSMLAIAPSIVAL